MTDQERASTAAWFAICAAAVPAMVLTVLLWGRLAGGDAINNLGGAVAGAGHTALGALIVRRARNRTGWFLIVEGGCLVFLSLASAWAIFGLDHPGTLPAPAVAGLLADCCLDRKSTRLNSSH